MTWDLNLFSRALKYVENSFGKSLERIGVEYDVKPIIKPLDVNRAREDVISLVGEGEYKAAGIDGSIDYNINLDLITVYVAVSTVKLPFTVGSEGITLRFEDTSLDDRLSMFKVIPFWSDQLPDITQASSLLDERSMSRSIESIPTSLMTLGEYYVARRIIEDQGDVRVIFMDRPFASTYSPQFRTARNVLWSGGGVLHDPGLYGEPLSITELYVILYHGPYPGFIEYQPVPSYLPHYIIYKSMRLAWENGESRVSLKEVSKNLPQLSMEKIGRILNRFLEERLDSWLIEMDVDGSLYLDDIVAEDNGVFRVWRKASRIYDRFLDDLFKRQDVVDPSHPLFIGDKPVSLGELSHIIIHQVYRIIHGAREKGVLTIGIGKDTSVTDFPRVVLPLLRDRGYNVPPPNTLPRTDRMIFSLISTRRSGEMPDVWRSIGYDNAFGTLVYRGSSLYAARKTISHPRLLIRNYFQLRKHVVRGGDGGEVVIRSPVFFYDRPYIPSIDDNNLITLETNFTKGGRSRKVDVDFYMELDTVNPIDNLILYLLRAFDNPELLESSGHNYLLFMADKEVKRMVKIVRSSISNVINNRIYTVLRRMGVYILTRRFREYRAEIERMRRR